MKLEVIYARQVMPGDVVVGEVNVNAPTRPVQPSAAGMKVTKVSRERTERDLLCRFHYGTLESPWRHPLDLIMVVR